MSIGVTDIRFSSNITHIIIQFDLLRRIKVERIMEMVNKRIFGLYCVLIIGIG